MENITPGINILTDSQGVIVDGAEEAIEAYNNGEISAEELYNQILNAEVVYVDAKEFKGKIDQNKASEQ